jgi:hypothetical protein
MELTQQDLYGAYFFMAFLLFGASMPFIFLIHSCRIDEEEAEEKESMNTQIAINVNEIVDLTELQYELNEEPLKESINDELSNEKKLKRKIKIL